MKTLCLGGSFNPIHHGHLICARAVAEAAGFGRVLLIPSRQPPHKNDTDLADAAHRLAMCRVAIESAAPKSGVQFEVSDIELQRTGASYTIDTVRELRRQGWPTVSWLIGADMLNILPKWHESAALLQETEFIIMARPGISINWSAFPASYSALKNNLVVAPLIEISSTEIRRRVRGGLGIGYLTPAQVVEYIANHCLYTA